MPWQKGQSGNPGGRKPVHESLAEMVRKRTRDGKILLEKAMELLEHPDPDVRKATVAMLKEWGWGKAPQPVQVQPGPDGPLMQIVYPIGTVQPAITVEAESNGRVNSSENGTEEPKP